ncbi:polysaccharide deacetylase family protein [Salinimicrobium sp. HB62]|uniref:polysaccharide deacetylase family protein n=1 Tax=Salinimicrobium sp. HB62 TaxID=3077781 RepID=UPI002D78C16C|nr:polysaccharide deacetylase family protein [Salinimicrobium sp. HB62]
MLIVSNYHYIREDFTAKHPSIFGLTPRQFREQLEELAKHGSFISPEELIQHKEKPFKKDLILITFDDGLKEQYELAKPILDKMGIPAVFFINTSNFKEQNVSLVHKIHLLRSRLSSEDILQELKIIQSLPLSEKDRQEAISHYNYDEEQTALLKFLLNFKMSLTEQEKFISPLFDEMFEEKKVASELYFEKNMLQELNDLNMLGSHSHRHLPLGQLSAEILQKELKDTQDFFRNNFGKMTKTISYPYGSYEASRGISEEVEKAGFKLGFTMERAASKSLTEDSLLLSRFDCNDLPLGKNDLFEGQHIFTNPRLRKWHNHESSFIDKR